MVSDRSALQKTSSALLSIDLFSWRLKALWVAVLLAAVCLELLSVPPAYAWPVYAYWLSRAFLFLALGFLSPLAFVHFSAMNRGALLAAIAASLAALLPGLNRSRPDFFFLALAVQLVLLAVGFSCGVVCRYDKNFSLFQLQIRLSERRS